MQRDAPGLSLFMCGRPCCWWHDSVFVRGEERSVWDKDFINKMQIQVLMTAFDKGGGKSLLCWNFDEILF